MDYIASYYQTYEDILFTGQPQNGKTLQDYVDLTSAAQCYIINELSKNPRAAETMGIHVNRVKYLASVKCIIPPGRMQRPTAGQRRRASRSRRLFCARRYTFAGKCVII